MMDIKEFLKKENKIAVVGASSNPDKWGFKVYNTLKRLGFEVYPVNPRHEKINNDTCYHDLKSLPEKPDVVITVVPPGITEEAVKECREIGIKKVWMQPGSESQKAVDFCKGNGIEVIYNICFVADGLKEKW